jgi:hypothetical protein
MIVVTEKIISKMLNGHLEKLPSASGVTFEPTLIPIKINEICFICSGTEKSVRKIANRVDTKTGPIRNGAGSINFQPNNEPSIPVKSAIIIDLMGFIQLL